MDDQAVEAVFREVEISAGQLDILVNVAWGGYERMVENGQFTYIAPFWQQPLWRWDSMMTTGVRAAFVASQYAARLMVPARRGLIVNISFWAAQKYLGNTIYGISKAATDKMTLDMAHELKPHGVTAVSLYPGLVRTEAVLAAKCFDLSNSESPEFIGRVIAALAADPNVSRRNGAVLAAATVAEEYNVTDIDGRRPRPLTLADV
jgi:NAD(P)-dependent dehydrogenase (short-subunit alcohol dehydrogenase family)